jgi:ribose 5-phosphate isomerase B
MIALAFDHGGLTLKDAIVEVLDELGLEYKDFGAHTAESTDYALWGYPAAKAVASGACEKGILVCGTGVGMSLTANKVKGIRCVVCTDCYTALLSRKHNNANVLALGGRVVGPDLAKLIVRMWLQAGFEGGRHQRRIDQVAAIENGTFTEAS